MKLENYLSRAFIDLAKIGRTNWRTVALTFLLIKFLTYLLSLISLVTMASAISFEHRLFYIPDAGKRDVYAVVEAAAWIFGLWLACKQILRRPFRSLISTDMTFDIRRCFLGAALCLPANAVSLIACSLFSLMTVGVLPFNHFEWPRYNEQLIASIGMLIMVPFLAFAEELFFRAWLTQTVGHYIRPTILVVALVAVLFAAAHTNYDFRTKAQMMFDSLGLSALCLRDRRLELSIGAHSMMNLCVALQLLFFTGPLPHMASLATSFDIWSIAILRSVLPYAIMFQLMQMTRGWYVPTAGRLTISGHIDPRYLGS